uniref:Uncharacterized protein n=1 Tax=Strigamia maritima TaxID=126957 RepID=T1ISG1_STRMM
MAKENDLHQFLHSNCFYVRISIRIFPLLFWLGLTNPTMAWEKISSRFPLISSFIQLTKKDPLGAHMLATGGKASHRNTISNPNNPAFQLHHNKGLRLHKRAADDDDDDGGDWEKDYSYNSNNSGNSGVQGGTIGLNEMEITLIVVCSAIGLLMFIIGLIFLARYYWKKFHGDSHRYHGVMQRNSSESSMGTTRADPKDATAKFEEPEAANPYLLHPSDALLIKQQIIEQSVEKEPLLPCANGTAFTDRHQIDNSDIRNETIFDTSLGVTNLKKQLPSGYVAQLQNTLNCRTGLSQSDCSISSFTATNPSYKYGNQTGYMSGYYGYPSDTTFDNSKTTTTTTPEITSTIANNDLTPSVTFRSGSGNEIKSTETQLSIEKTLKEELTDQAANELNEFDSAVEDDIILSADPYRLTGTTRALSLPESFDREEDTEDESKGVDSVRPTDSGWGDTVKGQFRGSLPVLHLSVSPEKEKVSVINGANSYPKSKKKTSDKSLPISLSNMLPNHPQKS